jgi:hypothetical protein
MKQQPIDFARAVLPPPSPPCSAGNLRSLWNNSLTSPDDVCGELERKEWSEKMLR